MLMMTILHLLALFLLVLLGFYIFVENPRNRAHQTFASFIALLGLWTTKDLFFWNFEELQRFPEIWAATSFIVALFMQYTLIVFAWVFPENSRTPRRKAAIFFSPGLVLIPATITGFLWKEISFDDGKLRIELTTVTYFFVFYIYLLFSYGFLVLFKKYLHYRKSQEGKQLGAILWSIGITVILKTLANVILPFLGNYDFLPISSLFVLPGVLICAYAISNFNLFSLETALDQFKLFPLTYKIALIVAAIAAAGFFVFQVPIVWWVFGNGADFEAWRKYLVFSIVSALLPNLLIVLLIIRAISRPLQKITLAAIQVINGEYGTQVELRKTNDEIGILADAFNKMSQKMADDIERLRKLHEHLIQTEKLAAMGTLTAGIAHEINNPLASISSLIQIIQKNKNLDEDVKEKLKIILSQIMRIKQVTSDMMEFSRVRPSSRTLLNINSVLESSLRLVSFDKTFQKIEVKKEFDNFLPEVYADINQMQQVFLNILLNARDAMPNGGKLTIKTLEEENFVVIEFTDTGIGIEKENLRKVFDPFFTTKSKGTGLGLAVCYGIVTAHGGKIEAQSDSGKTKFIVRLPKNKARKSEPEPL
ncbi:MAG: ATP-binding protein [Pyrinomonadaceae bacterium]|nr:ATP-binding protein [Pyrinomonadaceae bacterium]MCX7640454.1 ATP-binding protein [Pyrinomonadaceae bacterium]